MLEMTMALSPGSPGINSHPHSINADPKPGLGLKRQWLEILSIYCNYIPASTSLSANFMASVMPIFLVLAIKSRTGQ
jgi:hypothetical protein